MKSGMIALELIGEIFEDKELVYKANTSNGYLKYLNYLTNIRIENIKHLEKCYDLHCS